MLTNFYYLPSWKIDIYAEKEFKKFQSCKSSQLLLESYTVPQ